MASDTTGVLSPGQQTSRAAGLRRDAQYSKRHGAFCLFTKSGQSVWRSAMEETEDASSPSKTDDVAVLVGTEEQDMVTLQSWCLCALTDIVYA